MSKKYFILKIHDSSHNQKEIIGAFLAQIDDLIGITEYDDHVSYCFKNKSSLNEAIEMIKSLKIPVRTFTEIVEQRNWNKIWEDGFEPVLVNDFCAVIAPHHEPLSHVEHCIVINPEMSFGTGHHETTHMMIEYLEEFEVNGKRVLDFGCGTGVLAILGEKKGAIHVDAIDYDQLCFDSTITNARINDCKKMNTVLGDVNDIKGEYDLILANVNRNVLLDASDNLCKALKEDGTLLLSGLLINDHDIIIDSYSQNLKKVDQKTKGEWLAIRLKK